MIFHTIFKVLYITETYYQNKLKMHSNCSYNQTMARKLIKDIDAKEKEVPGYFYSNVVLPINKVDGVLSVCEIVLAIKKKHATRYLLTFTISISTPERHSEVQEVFEKVLGNKNITERETFLNWLVLRLEKVPAMINTLRVSPERNRFTENFAEENEAWLAKKAFCDTLSPETIERLYKECSICDEYTTLTTKCNHHICLPCLSHLQKQKCPMCRNQLYEEDDYDDDDDESDSDDEGDGNVTENGEEAETDEETDDTLPSAVLAINSAEFVDVADDMSDPAVDIDFTLDRPGPFEPVSFEPVSFEPVPFAHGAFDNETSQNSRTDSEEYCVDVFTYPQ